jgi:hypothetical protein
MVLGLLTLAIAWMGAHKGLVRAWAGNAAVLALVAVVPTLTSIPTGTIL